MRCMPAVLPAVSDWFGTAWYTYRSRVTQMSPQAGGKQTSPVRRQRTSPTVDPSRMTVSCVAMTMIQAGASSYQLGPVPP